MYNTKCSKRVQTKPLYNIISTKPTIKRAMKKLSSQKVMLFPVKCNKISNKEDVAKGASASRIRTIVQHTEQARVLVSFGAWRFLLFALCSFSQEITPVQQGLQILITHHQIFTGNYLLMVPHLQQFTKFLPINNSCVLIALEFTYSDENTNTKQ